MLTDIADRAKHLKTSGAGVIGAAVVFYIFTSFGCHLPSNWAVWFAAAVPAILGILAK